MATFKFTSKYACAAFFNMARDNFHRTIMDILYNIGYKKNYKEIGLDGEINGRYHAPAPYK